MAASRVDLPASFERHLRAENKSARTVETYLEASNSHPNSRFSARSRAASMQVSTAQNVSCFASRGSWVRVPSSPPTPYVVRTMGWLVGARNTGMMIAWRPWTWISSTRVEHHLLEHHPTPHDPPRQCRATITQASWGPHNPSAPTSREATAGLTCGGTGESPRFSKGGAGRRAQASGDAGHGGLGPDQARPVRAVQRGSLRRARSKMVSNSIQSELVALVMGGELGST